MKLPSSFDILKLKCCKFLLSWRYFPCHSAIGHLNSLSFGFSSLINCYIFAGREEKPTWMVFGLWLHPLWSKFHFCILLKAKCISVACIYSAENAVMLSQESTVIRFEHTAGIYISIIQSDAALVKITHHSQGEGTMWWWDSDGRWGQDGQGCQTALKRGCYGHRRHLWHIQTNSGNRKGPLGRAQGRFVPVIKIPCLLLPLFSLPLCRWVLQNLFESSRMSDLETGQQQSHSFKLISPWNFSLPISSPARVK